MEKKIKSRSEIEKIVQELKENGKKIVTYNGSFDILHIGHIHSIQEAKSQGDVLILLLNSDKSIKQYKSSKRPIIAQHDRALILASLMYVDYIVIFDELNPKKVLDVIKPDIHCNGLEWGKDCIEKYTVEKNGGKIHILHRIPNSSTTQLIKKIIESYKTSPIKAVFIDRDGTINDNKNGYVHKKEEFSFKKGVIESLQKLSSSGYKIIIVTNQSGIKKELYNENDLHTLHHWMLEELRKNNVRIDQIYYCPHDESDSCNCRKPNIGMILKGVEEFDISLCDSWMIGDDDRDILCGREANLRTIKIGDTVKDIHVEPHSYAKDLDEAIDIILSS